MLPHTLGVLDLVKGFQVMKSHDIKMLRSIKYLVRRMILLSIYLAIVPVCFAATNTMAEEASLTIGPRLTFGQRRASNRRRNHN